MSFDHDVLRPSVFNLTKTVSYNKTNDYIIGYWINTEMEARRSYGKIEQLDMNMYNYALSIV